MRIINNLSYPIVWLMRVSLSTAWSSRQICFYTLEKWKFSVHNIPKLGPSEPSGYARPALLVGYL